MNATPSHLITWFDGRENPQCPPNPAYPDGVAVDLTSGARPACDVKLPYPAKRIGRYTVTCRACGYRAVITTAGRKDDPKSVKLPCKGREGRAS